MIIEIKAKFSCDDCGTRVQADVPMQRGHREGGCFGPIRGDWDQCTGRAVDGPRLDSLRAVRIVRGDRPPQDRHTAKVGAEDQRETSTEETPQPA